LIMDMLIDITSGFFLLLGSLFCLIGGIGLMRMPDFYTRMHAVSVAETLGVGFMLVGLIMLAGWSLVTAKLLMLGLLIFFVGPTAAHTLALAAWSRGVKPLLFKKGELPSKR